MQNRAVPVRSIAISLLLLAGFMVMGTRLTHARPPRLPGQATGQQIHATMIRHYQQTRLYHARQQWTLGANQAGWTVIRKGTFIVALDRPGQRLVLKTPDSELVIDDDHLHFRQSQVPGRFLKAPKPAQLTRQVLGRVVPPLKGNFPLDLALLLDDRQDHPIVAAVPRVIGPGMLPTRLDLDMKPAPAEVELNKKGMIVQYLVPATNPGRPDIAVVDIDILALDQPVADDVFAFDPRRDTEVSNFTEFVRGPGGAQAGGGPGAGPGGMAPSSGAANQSPAATQAPLFDLESLDGPRFDLSRQDDRVIVVSFWASWAGTSPTWMPMYDKLAKWAHEQTPRGRVKCIAVSTGEQLEVVKRYVTATQLKVPVLLDPDRSVSRRYNVQLVPHTVVIHEGKIIHTQVGIPPDPKQYEKDFKQTIRELLQDDHEAEPDKQHEDATETQDKGASGTQDKDASGTQDGDAPGTTAN